MATQSLSVAINVTLAPNRLVAFVVLLYSTNRSMKPINIEKLMGHSVGISDPYYRATEKEILDDYLKALTILYCER